MRAAREAVQAGATLLLSGKSLPLLQAYASWTGGKPLAEAAQRPDILFEDFEHGYGKWKVEGEAFGKEPAHGTLPNQQPVSGFLGQGLVNSFLRGDDTTGRLVSQPFTIERQFIRFLVGGGHHATTQIRLLVDGKVVCATSGKDIEQLQPATWDVGAFQGQKAHIEIVDEQQGRLGAYQRGSDRVHRHAGESSGDAGAGGVAAGAVQPCSSRRRQQRGRQGGGV